MYSLKMRFDYKGACWVIIVGVFGLFGIFLALYFLISPTAGLGWLFGWLGVAILRGVRSYSHRQIGDMVEQGNISIVKYVLNIILVLASMAIPLLISFKYQEIIHPLAVFAAYFSERALVYIKSYKNTASKGGSSC